MGKAVPFKEATFLEGRLIRVSKRKVDIEFDDGDDGGPSLLTLRLADDADIDLDTIGEDVKAVIVDGKVAKITPLTVNPATGRTKTPVQLSNPQRDI